MGVFAARRAKYAIARVRYDALVTTLLDFQLSVEDKAKIDARFTQLPASSTYVTPVTFVSAYGDPYVLRSVSLCWRGSGRM